MRQASSSSSFLNGTTASFLLFGIDATLAKSNIAVAGSLRVLDECTALCDLLSEIVPWMSESLAQEGRDEHRLGNLDGNH